MRRYAECTERYAQSKNKMSRKSITIKFLILFTFLSCTNKKESPAVIEDEKQIQEDNWIMTELKKQLKSTNTTDSIEIYGLPIEDMPELVYQNPKIRYLRIDCIDFNCMKTLSSRIAQLKYLETLIISKSALKELPSEIGELTNLKKLMILGGGKLSSIPNEISELEKLEELDFWRNNLSEFSVHLNNMKHLKLVNLGENKLSQKYIETMRDRFPGVEIKTHR